MTESILNKGRDSISAGSNLSAAVLADIVRRIELCQEDSEVLKITAKLLSACGGIPLAAHASATPNGCVIHECHLLFTKHQPSNDQKAIALSDIREWTGPGNMILSRKAWSSLGLSAFCESQGFTPDTVIVSPCNTSEKRYFLVCADYAGSPRLAELQTGLIQVAAAARLKLDNLRLQALTSSLSAELEVRDTASNTGLNQAVARLRESEERYRSIFNSNADAILVFDIDGNIIEANDLACRTYGYSAKEIVGLSGKDIVHPDYAGLFGRFKATEPGQWFETESVDLRKGGIPFDIEIHGTKFIQGGSELLLAIVRDITERKTGEQALRDSESKYRNLVENLEETHFLYQHDKDGVFTYVSPSITQILGYSQTDFLAHYTRYMTGDPINKEAIRHTELSLQGQRQPPYQVEIIHKDGSVKWLEVSESPVTGEDGEVYSIQGIARDVTEKKKAEEALFQSKEQLRATFDNAAIGMMIAAPMGPISRANKSLIKILGYSKSELFSRSFLDLAHPDDRNKMKAGLLSLLAGSRQTLRLEKRLIRKDGRTAWGRLHVSALREPQGNVNFIIVAVEDITGLKEIEEVVRQKDVAIRDSYANVISAITGDRLIISTPEEVVQNLGERLAEPFSLTSYQDLSTSRAYLREVIEKGFPGCTTLGDIIAASGEAAANMIKHAAGGTITVFRKDQTAQLLMSDTGDGIHFTLLPRATLLPGFSTKQSLGVGFSIMLEMSNQIILSTQPGKTELLLERNAYEETLGSLPLLIQRLDV